MKLAPIILFVYNRPKHTAQTLKALAENKLASQSALYIYADGPKTGASETTLADITSTREIIKSKQWCKDVIITERDENYGLQRSVIEGVTQVVNKHGKVIVLEDDIVTSPHFLQFMNDALDVYEDEQKVLSIGALNFFATDNTVPDTFFIPIPDCWGWATWKNRWELFEPNAQLLLNRLREKDLVEKFNLNGAYNFESMLIDQIKGDVSSWAIRWQALAYLEDKLTLYPRCSVTKNIGFGAGGTHGGEDVYSKNIKFADKEIVVKKTAVAEDPAIINKMIAGYHNSTQPNSLIKLRIATRKAIKDLMPPFLSKAYRKLKPGIQKAGMWQGNYKNWAEAEKDCTGYDAPLILEKTKAAILKVKHGEAAFERDTVLFADPEYNWPVLTTLLKTAAENGGKLSVLDFGGSLGSAYFQNLPMLQSLTGLEWSIVEQPHYIKEGNEFIADGKLKFYVDVDSCLAERQPNVLLLSSVLQYLEHPYDWTTKLLELDFDYIIIDRTAFVDGAIDRLTVQNVPADIYEASYPSWFFNTAKLLNAFTANYSSIADFDPYPGLAIPLDGQVTGYYKGFILKRK
jgi:putative methyltransferase (TIGR04325 family)